MSIDTIRANKIGQTKLTRYWPGKAPEWAIYEAKIDDNIRVFEKVCAIQNGFDARLRRLSESRIGNRDEIRADRDEIGVMEFEEELDEDELDEQRRRIREKNLQRLQQQQEDYLPLEEEESESEYETESEEETTELIGLMVKPAFVAKSERFTIHEREERDKHEAYERSLWEELVKKRKLETKQLIVEKIRQDEVIHKNLESLKGNDAYADTYDDEVNDAEEYEAWKSREFSRIRRVKMEEIKRARSGSRKPGPRPKKKMKFMQKDYHRGAFFQSDPDDDRSAETFGADSSIYDRDFSAPTGEDKLDKSILPKIMQVKRFGHRGRTKWTHLVNEDTSLLCFKQCTIYFK